MINFVGVGTSQGLDEHRVSTGACRRSSMCAGMLMPISAIFVFGEPRRSILPRQRRDVRFSAFRCRALLCTGKALNRTSRTEAYCASLHLAGAVTRSTLQLLIVQRKRCDPLYASVPFTLSYSVTRYSLECLHSLSRNSDAM